ncbi:Spo0E family sporulation regulatory protein-aspartic acid phosphatase [Clostridium tyrobutyricum]|uniref:Spo0E like sporulation regulatory protein n=1 Tax=Clostridium tyrobutyricum DIVETGP TaxID=1408889 RepID=W6NHC4_CLOTY|nr:aspartyl-phosphate phosphatase Spo0E family protein [Clostridium tyrobutyricum]AND84253.1 hypothetical protein CTK_C09920 [Clostridium tyrobutyricum]AND84337.1 hypothetical protein CTK_C10760 [Clostridium tyrobutyricum]ANP68971.1 sporulation protein Spo0E [Clostridium tyrobutyricum]MBV4435427.1 aspartyl-phosphate phosphatase Spo0E family protein [Clostridium tyrobutyricum]QNB66681.1 Spo0E family sporulation regulatory protein-aspartic acid phosphatase [Clostridium tyrobutyricum]
MSNILLEIKNLQKHLNELIKEKDNLVDTEIIEISQMLDLLLNKYYKIIKNKMDKE